MEQVRKMIVSNRHNHTVTLYYLILKRNLRNGKFNTFDICSPNFDPSLLMVQSGQETNAKQKNNGEELEEISLERVTTAAGRGRLRAFSKNSSIRATNCTDSPDITAHNFYAHKSKDKKKTTLTNRLHQENDSHDPYTDTTFDFAPIPTTENRRKIHFQAPTKSLLTNSIDLKTINHSHNP